MLEKFKLVSLAIWAFFFTQVVQAATTAEIIGNYDPELIYWAAVMALMGGIARTIFSLQDSEIYWGTFWTAQWDAGKSLAAGLLVFWLIQIMRSYGWVVPNEMRSGAVLAAGILRFAAVFWLRDLGKEWLEARRSQIVNKPAQEPKEPS